MSIGSDTGEALKDEYLAQIAGIFPLHRVALLFVALVVVVAAPASTYKSVIEGLLHLQLRVFVNLEKGIFSATTVRDALTAIAVLLSGALLQRGLRLLFFVWIKRRLDLDSVTKRMSAKSFRLRDSSILNYFALKKSEREARNWGARISSLSMTSESAVTLSCTFLYATYFGNMLDFGVAVLFIVAAIFALAKSFAVFLRSYLPHAIHVKGTTGLGADLQLP